MNINKLKFDCGDISSIISSTRWNTPPTENQLEKFFAYINRPIEKLTAKQEYEIREIVLKQIDYDPNILSDTIKQSLCEIYAKEVLGKYSITGGGSKPHSLDKGRIGENDAIKMLSRADGVEYFKNERVFSNSHFKGCPDIVMTTGKLVKNVYGIKEIKIPYDAISFLRLLEEPISKHNSWQLQGYMDILNLDTAEICHCLISMPETMAQNKIKEMVERCQELKINEDEILSKIDFAIANMGYDEIPESNRLIRVEVKKNRARITDAKRKVKIARSWIAELDHKFNKIVSLE
jgi:hypothetical protein